MHRSFPFKLLAKLSGAPLRVGLTRRINLNLLTHSVNTRPLRNEREVYLDFLRILGIEAPYEGSRFYLSEHENSYLKFFLNEHKVSDHETVIAVAPGGGDNIQNSMPSKRWPKENFIQLVRQLLEEKSCRVVLVGGPKDRDLTAEIRSHCIGSIDATHLSFGEMASIFRRCQTYVGNDSGPLHIASAMGLSTVSLHGPTHPKQWAPPHTSNLALFKNVECSPCYNHGHFPDCDHLTCLQSIQVQEVLTAIDEALKTATLRAATF
jgi:ADP-heptose:LPS heptosyltransferase